MSESFMNIICHHPDCGKVHNKESWDGLKSMGEDVDMPGRSIEFRKCDGRFKNGKECTNGIGLSTSRWRAELGV